MIRSLLDNDLYNFTMAQVAWRNHPRTDVRYRFKNRDLGRTIAGELDLRELEEELYLVERLKFEDVELDYLRSTGHFASAFLDALKNDLVLPRVHLRVDQNGWLEAEYEGRWWMAMLWESMLLATITELLGRRTGDRAARHQEGTQRLLTKIDVLRENPRVRILEFGTRRRYSSAWQDFVVSALLEGAPDQLVGTSNLRLAMKHGIRAVGSKAHQMEMVHAAMFLAEGRDRRLGDAQDWDRRLWEDEYAERSPGLLIALPDTFGTEGYLRRWKTESAPLWAGLRQDSGDPVQVGELYEDFWRWHGVDPATKLTIFSDSLDLGRCISIDLHFGDRLNKVFGIGTDLTNDVGLKAPSMVVKPCAVKVGDDWHACVKLSDDLAKATGDRAAVDKYKFLARRD